ncbi:hypothetical protein BDA99DRAFT_295871 [Phascolomyces articulosus]|uniref:Uncharacterized protein n=1 Tax=Phascolomyces articulosus TaxID=60185 RepID=A0AAD5JZS1_9FUNG|nr:hypothetical protein BDA99DRAFT_295871 [Phascolomyces articulosus]
MILLENAKDEQQKNLMELMYDLQKPFSVFDVIPQSPPLKQLDDLSACGNDFEELSREFFSGGGNMTGHHANIMNGGNSMNHSNNNKRNRVMTAPSALFHGQPPPSSAFCAPFSATFTTPSHWSPFPSPVVTTTTSSTPGGYFYTNESPTSVYNPSSAVTTPFDGYPTHEHNNKEMMLPPTAPTMSIPPPLSAAIPASSGCLYTNNTATTSNPTLSTMTTTMPPPPLLHHNPKKRAREPSTSDALPPPPPSSSLPSLHPTLSSGKRIAIRTNDNVDPQIIELQEFTSHELKVKLCTVLSLHPDQVTHIVWRPKDKTSSTTPSNNNNNNNNSTITTKSSSSPRKKSNNHSHQDIFITMDDDFITQDLLTWQQPSASWEIKSDGTVRIILEN